MNNFRCKTILNLKHSIYSIMGPVHLKAPQLSSILNARSVMCFMPNRRELSASLRFIDAISVDGYPKNEIMYRWQRRAVEVADSRYWRLYQFAFVGMRNSSDVAHTQSGENLVYPRSSI